MLMNMMIVFVNIHYSAVSIIRRMQVLINFYYTSQILLVTVHEKYMQNYWKFPRHF